jgi:hypothetical protein
VPNGGPADGQALHGHVVREKVNCRSRFSHLNFIPQMQESRVTEERKFAILFAATILAARKLIDMDPDKPNMAKGYFVDKAIDDAVFILERIDARWPSIVNTFAAKD